MPVPDQNPDILADPTGRDDAECAFGEGAIIGREDPARLDAALRAVCDYRGDVTITMRDGTRIAGFAYDRRAANGNGPALLRMLPKDGSARVSIPEADIESVEITGKDTAAGKTFENWVRRYAEKKLRGEAANIESESLDE